MKEEIKLRALGEITNPYRLLQLIWITLEYPDYEWDVVIRYMDGNPDTVHQLADYCKKSGCFKNVVEINASGINGKITTKIKLFLKLFIYLITFRKKQFFKKTIVDAAGSDEYQIYCAESSLSFLGSAMMNMAKDKTVFVLEDGMCDYSGYFKLPHDVTYIIGWFLFKFGMVNYISKEYFSKNENCIKYAMNPQLLWERNYKEIKCLLDDKELLDHYREIIKKTFSVSGFDYDVVIFTDLSYSEVDYKDSELFVDWIDKTYKDKKILIKRHPRDVHIYDFNQIDISDKYKAIPGEIILDLITDEVVIFQGPSTLLMHINKDKEVISTHFSSIKMNPNYDQSYYNSIKFCSSDNLIVVDL